MDLLVICLALIISLFIVKNIIQSGCIVYPIHNTCFTKLTWSIDQKIVIQKNKKLQADSKGWSFYAKDHFNIKNKFVWKNLKGDNFFTYSQYANITPIFWLKYWMKDPNYKKIINLFALITIIYLLLDVILNNIDFGVILLRFFGEDIKSHKFLISVFNNHLRINIATRNDSGTVVDCNYILNDFM